MKQRLKKIDFIRENYRRIRKIVLHIRYGRFYKAFKLANRYNPLYWLVIRNKYYVQRKQKKNLVKVLQRNYSIDLKPNRASARYNIALVLRNGATSPTSSAFIRLISPLTTASAQGQVSLSLLSAKKPAVSVVHNIYIVQRTAFDSLRSAKKFVGQVKSNQAKLIIDNDDAFTLISESHPEYEVQLRRVESMEYLLEQADQVWVSEKELVNKALADKTIVVENTIDKRIWTKVRPKQPRTSKKLQLIYMGTATHDADFKMVLPALDKLNESYPNSFRLSMVGVSQDLPQREWMKQLYAPRFGSLYPTFVRWFLRQGPFDVGLSPLENTEFNRSKSDIKCLDYLAADVVPVVSDIAPYQGKEIEKYIIKVRDDEWFEALEKIVKNVEGFRKTKQQFIEPGQKYVWKYRSSDVAAKKILKQLNNL